MIRALRLALVAPLVGGVVGCVDKAALPPVRQAADPVSRSQIYADYKLTYDRGIFSETWKRKDGEYNLAELSDVLDAYPETMELKDKVHARRLVLGTFGGIGGGLIGFTLGWNLTASSENRMSSETQVALYSTGAGFLVIGLILQLTWRDPAWDLASTYNDALGNALGLPPGAMRPGARRVEPHFVLAPVPVIAPNGAVVPGIGGGAVF
jgi:hypothetical protein